MKSPGNIARYLLIVTLGLSACSSVAFGQTSSNRWSGNGPYGGAIRWFAIAQAIQAATRASVTEPTGQQVSRAVANGRVAFVSSEGNAFTDIYTMEADGSNVQRLTNNPGFDLSPKWSPDGTKIAFLRLDDYFDGPINIYVMNADGTNQTRLSNSGLDFDSRWSPDGTKIAFASIRDNNCEIYVMNADGSNVQRLTNYPA